MFQRGGKFGALSYRDYRLAFFGQAISAIGSWMQMVTLGWLVYDLTGSSFYLGLVGLARAIPGLVFTLVGGAAADRYNRRVIVATANAVVTLCTFILGVLCITGTIHVWHIIAIAFITGVAFAFEVPSRQALISSIVDPKDVVGALSMMAVAFNTAQVIGPAIAALLIEWISEGPVFLLNAVAYSSVVLAAIAMRVPGRGPSRGNGSILGNVLDGLRYIRRTPELCWLVLSMALLSLLARPFGQLMPAFARDILDVGAAGLGALNSATGAGALIGALAAASLGSYRGRGFALLVSAGLYGALLIVFGMSTSFTLSLVIAALVGVVAAFSGINTNTMLQAHADPRMRGRVISLHGLTMMGVVPLGVMLEGGLGSVFGVPLVMIVAGIVSVAVVAYTIVAAPQVRELA
ncbi:MAG: MFS transporter [Chloroflexi bacterium]|nr:MFS transporter [Chloroflexota bacterium]